MSDTPSRDGVEALIASLRNLASGYAAPELTGDYAAADALTSLLARLAEVEKALELIASLGGRTLLGPEWDIERHHETGAAHAFEQAADIARAALHPKGQ